MAVALITGATSGIGEEVARELASHGVNLALHYNSSKDKAERLKKILEDKYGVLCIAYKCDITKEFEVSDMINNIIDDMESIDIVVNNAGIALDNFIEDKSADEFRRVIDVNLVGTFLVSKYASLKMKRGAIVNVSSTNAIDSYYPESVDYDASKAGVISLTHNFALKLAPNIRVNCVCPGWVNTKMNKELTFEQIEDENSKILLGRFADPIEIAKVIVFLCGKEASYVNDSIIKVDGGRHN